MERNGRHCIAFPSLVSRSWVPPGGRPFTVARALSLLSPPLQAEQRENVARGPRASLVPLLREVDLRGDSRRFLWRERRPCWASGPYARPDGARMGEPADPLVSSFSRAARKPAPGAMSCGFAHQLRYRRRAVPASSPQWGGPPAGGPGPVVIDLSVRTGTLRRIMPVDAWHASDAAIPGSSVPWSPEPSTVSPPSPQLRGGRSLRDVKCLFRTGAPGDAAEPCSQQLAGRTSPGQPDGRSRPPYSWFFAPTVGQARASGRVPPDWERSVCSSSPFLPRGPVPQCRSTINRTCARRAPHNQPPWPARSPNPRGWS